MIPQWCFQLMGNHLSCVCVQLQQPEPPTPPPPPPPPVGTIKLINSDGIVKIYHQPIHVSDLMMEFPKHMVCRSDSFYIGQKIPALSKDDQLQLGYNYFLLPNHFFHSVLSFVNVANFACSSSSSPSRNAFLKKAASSCQPFHIQKTPSGCLRIRVSEEFISQLMGEGKMIKVEEGRSGKTKSRVCTTPQLQKDYTQLVACRQWMPKLETIREKTHHDGRRKQLSSLIGLKMKIRTRKKKPPSSTTGNWIGGTHKTRRSEQHQHHLPRVTSSSAKRRKPHPKDKIKI